MRVLHVIAGLAPRYGGPSAAVPQMARAIASRGHHAEILTTDVDGPGHLPVLTGEPLEWQGVMTTFFKVGWPKDYKASTGLLGALRRRIREFDVVHIHSLYLFHTLVAGHYCRRFSVPYVQRPHGTLDPYHRRQHRLRKAVYDTLAERRHLNSAAGIHYTSTAERDFAENLRLKARPFVVPLGVDAATLNAPTPPHALLSIEPRLAGRTLITFIGRLTSKKRLELLVEAFAALEDTHPRAHLVIAGPDDEGIGQRLRARILELGLTDRVSLLGLVTGSAKTALLQQSHVFVLPSHDENFAVAVVEAMAAGLPVVVTTGIALHREIEQAGAGVVVPSTPAAIASAMHRLLGDPAMSASMGRRGHALATSTFAWDRIAVDLERMYQEAILHRSTRPTAGANEIRGQNAMTPCPPPARRLEDYP